MANHRYIRKTHSPAELSAACSRASLSRKRFAGERPRRPGNEFGTRSLKVRALDFEVLRRLAADGGRSLADTLHVLAAILINGHEVKPHPDFAPEGWRFLLGKEVNG